MKTVSALIAIVLVVSSVDTIAEHAMKPKQTKSKNIFEWIARNAVEQPDEEGLLQKEPSCPFGYTDVATPEQIEVINQITATRPMRLMHVLWHTGRSDRLDTRAKNALTSVYGKEAIVPASQRVCPAPDEKNDKTSGEDFLFMHRQMIWRLKIAFQKAGVPCLSAWKTIPEKDDENFPVVGNEGAKSDESLAYMKEWEEIFNDEKWLQTHTLSELGWLIEFSIHNMMHMRFSTSYDQNKFGGGARLPFSIAEWKSLRSGDFPWDDPEYNNLGDPYSSHVNPIFWKLHGLVDGFIDKWLAANAKLNNGPKEIKWTGKWAGVAMKDLMKFDEYGKGEANEAERAFASALGGKKAKAFSTSEIYSDDEGGKDTEQPFMIGQPSKAQMRSLAKRPEGQMRSLPKRGKGAAFAEAFTGRPARMETRHERFLKQQICR